MNVAAIIASIREFTATVNYKEPQESSLRGKILSSYNIWAAEKLNKILTDHTSIFNKLYHLLNNEEPNLVDDLKDFLILNWLLVDGSMLAPTAINQEKITKLLCDIALFVAEKTNADLEQPITALTALMYSLDIEYLRSRYPDLDLMDVHSIIKTHILGNNFSSGHQFLLPIKLLCNLNLTDLIPAVSEEQYQRLTGFNNLTRNLKALKEEFQQLNEDNNSTLLFQLRQLCKHLDKNSMNGFGNSDNAAGPAYIAIINFFNFYNNLEKKQIEKLPDSILESINFLFKIVTDAKFNDHHDDDDGTCILGIGYQIKAAIKEKEDLLDSITLCESAKQQRIIEIQRNFEEKKLQLEQAITNNELIGSDTLSIPELFDSYYFPLEVKHIQDLHLLMHLPIPRLGEILDDVKIRQDIWKVIKDIQNLALFIQEIPAEKLSLFLGKMKEELIKNVVYSYPHVKFLLDNINEEKMRILCTEWADIGIFQNPQNFSNLFMELNEIQFRIICQQLPNLMLNFIDYCYLYYSLGYKSFIGWNGEDGEERYNYLYNITFDLVKNNLTSIPANFLLQFGLNYLSLENFNILLEIIRNKSELKLDYEKILTSTNENHQFSVYEALKEKLLSENTDIKKIFAIIAALKSNINKKDFYFQKKHLLPKLLLDETNKLTIFNFIEFCKTLDFDNEIFRDFCNYLDDFLPKVLKDAVSFNNLMEKCTPEQRVILESRSVPIIIKTCRDVYDIKECLQWFSGKQRLNFYYAYKSNLMQMIEDLEDLRVIIALFPANIGASICLEVKDKLNVDQEVLFTFEHFNLEFRTIFLNIFPELLPRAIDTTAKLIKVIKLMPAEEIPGLLEKINLAKVITSSTNLLMLLKDLSANILLILLPNLNDHMSNLIKSIDDFSEIYNQLILEVKFIFFASMLDHIAAFPNFLEDFLISLALREYKFLLLEYKNELFALIHTSADILDWFWHLDLIQKDYTYNLFKDNFFIFINTADDLINILTCLTHEQAQDFICNNQTVVANLMHNKEELIDLWQRAYPVNLHEVIFDNLNNEFVAKFIKDPSVDDEIAKLFSKQKLEQLGVTVKPENKRPKLLKLNFFAPENSNSQENDNTNALNFSSKFSSTG